MFVSSKEKLLDYNSYIGRGLLGTRQFCTLDCGKVIITWMFFVQLEFDKIIKGN